MKKVYRILNTNTFGILWFMSATIIGCWHFNGIWPLCFSGGIIALAVATYSIEFLLAEDKGSCTRQMQRGYITRSLREISCIACLVLLLASLAY